MTRLAAPSRTIELTFLGTRANTQVCSNSHRMHSSILVSCSGTRVMIDCGADWLSKIGTISPDAILLTHAHTDHALGLEDGAPCPVYATAETWHLLGRLPISHREHVRPESPFMLGPIEFKAVAVIHSPVAPAVGYHVATERKSFFYAPDVLRIPDRARALSGINLYVGDGARLYHPIIRGKGDLISGHASIRQQLAWCETANVKRAIFSHCGTPIITAAEAEMNSTLSNLGNRFQVEASFACDGDVIRL